MSNVIKGRKYQLAGFNIAQKGTLVNVFAKFCGVDEDPANLPERKPLHFANTTMDMGAIYPVLSPEEITKALIGPSDLAAREDIYRLPGHADEIVSDLGHEKMAQVLVEMGRAKRDYLNRDEWITTFVPAAAGPKHSHR